MEPLAHQRAALDEITARARAYFAGDWQQLPVIPRWASLMIGPTGTGKTAVAAMAAEALGDYDPATLMWGNPVSLLRVSAPNWMPSGANNRGTRETISVIAEHVAKHDRTLLAIDEIEKITDRDGDSSWKMYCRGELFDLLDGRWPSGLTLPEVDDDTVDPTIVTLTEKLKETVFFLAIGTFQSWFDDSTSRRTMGFGAETDPANDELTADIVAEKMPRELANRLNSSLIRIQELTPADYHRIANEAADKLPQRMQQAFRAEVQRRIPGAIAAKKGVRFLEECIMEVLKTLPPSPEIVGEIVITTPKIPKIDLCTLL